jgi:hypothetical protein
MDNEPPIEPTEEQQLEQMEEHMAIYHVPTCVIPDCKGCLAWFRKHWKRNPQQQSFLP